MQGTLNTVDLPQLIELARDMGDQVAVYLETPQGQWAFYIEHGDVVHIEGPDVQGEPALRQALLLRQGHFRLAPNTPPPKRTIQQPWNALLLETLRQLDEATPTPTTPIEEEVPMSRPKKTRERIAETLSNLLAESSDIIGAAVVGIDGLIYSAEFPHRTTDPDLTAAAAAAVYGLSQRTMQQLRSGQFVQTLIEGSDGYLLVRNINPQTIFVAVLPKEVNLGMAFAEARTITAQLADILQALR